MKSKRKIIIKITAAVLSLIIAAAAITGCTDKQNTDEQSTSKTTTTTTTTTTTENPSTTFAETQTRKIYKGLKKDSDGSYPYKIASYTTYYKASDKTRTANLEAAIGKINNIKIPDGDVFSFNQTVGKRTVTAGYQTAKVVQDGEFVDGLGGGVCQVSSTIFECVLRANIKIVERTCHTLKVSYVPLGGDATVQWNSKDFQFENNLGCDIRLSMSCSGGNLTCSVYAKKKVDPGNVKINISKSGDDYILTRTVNGKQNYRTSSHYQEQKKKTTTTTTKKR